MATPIPPTTQGTQIQIQVSRPLQIQVPQPAKAILVQVSGQANQANQTNPAANKVPKTTESIIKTTTTLPNNSNSAQKRILTPIIFAKSMQMPNGVSKISAPPLIALKHNYTTSNKVVLPNLSKPAPIVIAAPALTPSPPLPLPLLPKPYNSQNITKISNVKVVKKMNVPFNSIEMSQELVLKSNLIKQFVDQGTAVNQSMLTSMNVFCSESKKLYANKCKVLNEELLKIRHKCYEQDEKINELALKLKLSETQNTNATTNGAKIIEKEMKEFDDKECQTIENKYLYNDNEHNEHLNSLLSVIRNLGSKFLTDVELNLKDSIKSAKFSSLPQEEKVEETLGSLATKLYDLLQEATEQERHLYSYQLGQLLEKLLEKPPDTDDYTIDNAFIDQLPIKDLSSSLLNDVNMGVQLEVPRFQMMRPQKINGAPPKTGTFVVHDLYQYMQACAHDINESGDRPIHRDVIKNNLAEVKRQCVAMKLLSMSVDVCNEDYQTPLHLAVIHNASIEIICTLLKYNADICMADTDGNTVLHFAVESETLSRLLHPSVRELVDDASYKRLVNKLNNEGYAPLHLAAINGKKKPIEELLALNADIDCCDTKSGRTALHHAIENNNVDIVLLLKQNNADPYVKNYSGTSIIDSLADAESDFSSEIKKIFYNDRLKVLSSREDPDDPPETSSKGGKRAKRASRAKGEGIIKKRKA